MATPFTPISSRGKRRINASLYRPAFTTPWVQLLFIAIFVLYITTYITRLNPTDNVSPIACPPPVEGEEDLTPLPAELYKRAGGWQETRGGTWKKFKNYDSTDKQFFAQPDPGGWTPCLIPSPGYITNSSMVLSSDNYIVAVVTGGLNQMRRQIGAAVVIARVLRASLVVPVLSVNHIWKDKSEFVDLFDLEHFRKVLSSDVRIVTTLPVAHLRMQRAVERQPKLFSDPHWLITNLYERLSKDHVMLLRGLDSTLADDLPSDLQKLRCKVEFEALRFAAPIRQLGRQLAKRMSAKGPYLSLHLRLEKDVWIRTGCLTRISKALDAEILQQRKEKEQYLTGKTNLTAEEREKKGLCPLSALMVARILKSLGATNVTRVFWAGGDPYGGDVALSPIYQSFGDVETKMSLATADELAGFMPHSNMLAALDFIVCFESDVFMPSHGGNMAHVLRGHRMYYGHRKFILPNKRKLMASLLDPTVTDEELKPIVVDAHKELFGPPQFRTARTGRDVIGFPVPECMCSSNGSHGD